MCIRDRSQSAAQAANESAAADRVSELEGKLKRAEEAHAAALAAAAEESQVEVSFMEEESADLRQQLDAEKESNASRREELTALTVEYQDRAEKAEEEAASLRKELEDCQRIVRGLRDVQKDGLVAAALAGGAIASLPPGGAVEEGLPPVALEEDDL